MFNQFNLSSDLMEPYRPIVDKYVYDMRPEKFEKDEKHYLLNIFLKEVHINSKKEYLGNAIKIYVRSIFDALNDNDVSLIRFYEYEL